MRLREPREVRGKPWLAAGLLGLALLIVPALALVFAPRVGHFVAPRPPRQSLHAPSPSSDPEGEAADDDAVEDAATRRAADAGAEPDEHGIGGSVVDPDGKPVDDAEVRCVDQPELATTTRSGGRFYLALAADGCKVVARHAEYAPSREQRLDVGRPNELRLQAGGSIEGVVIDERGSGVTPVMIAVESFHPAGGVTDAPSPSRSARSFDARDGSFTFGKLAPGKYMLTASAERRPPAHSEMIDVEAGRVARGVKIILAQGGRLTGRVVDRVTHRAVDTAKVSLDRSTPAQVRDAGPILTDDRGRFTLEGAPLGPFSLKVVHPDYKTKIVTSLTTSPGGAPTDVVIELTPRGDAGSGTEMSGIGAMIAPAVDAVRVAGLLPNSPAGRAGLHTGDEIVMIDGADVTKLSIDEAMQHLRGPAGSRVVVTVRRAEGSIEIAITRGEL